MSSSGGAPLVTGAGAANETTAVGGGGVGTLTSGIAASDGDSTAQSMASSAGGGSPSEASATTSTGSASMTSGGMSQTGPFELLWDDDFDTLDLTRWELMTHSWDGNLAQFSEENASTASGILRLSLTDAPDDTTKPYRGVEMRSRDTLTYGRVSASIRFARGPGVVSSLVTLYTPWPPPDWNELDVEFLGKGSSEIQFNHMVNIPPADPETGHLQFPELVTLPFDATGGFHTYTIEWVPGEARFFVDDLLYHTATEEMARMVLPQNILLTIWCSDAQDWAGAVDATTSPTSVEVDWIKVYAYTGG